MYTYEYERVKCGLDGWGFLGGNVYDIGDFQTIIDNRAKEGWKYVGFIPSKQRGTGHIQEITLIFEKQVTKN